MAFTELVETRGITVFSFTCAGEQQSDIEKLRSAMSKYFPVSLHWEKFDAGNEIFTAVKFWIDKNSLPPGQEESLEFIEELASQTADLLMRRLPSEDIPYSTLLTTQRGNQSTSSEKDFFDVISRLSDHPDFAVIEGGKRRPVYGKSKHDKPKDTFSTLRLVPSRLEPGKLTFSIQNTEKKTVAVEYIEGFDELFNTLFASELVISGADLETPHELDQKVLHLTEQGRSKVARFVGEAFERHLVEHEQLSLL